MRPGGTATEDFKPTFGQTFESALNVWLRDQFPMIGGSHVRKLFIEELKRLMDRYHPLVSRLKMGQALWVAVHKDAPWDCKQPMSETRLQPVVLSLFTMDDLKARMAGVPATRRMEDVVARLVREAAQQDGVLSHRDLALLLQRDMATIGDRIRSLQSRGEPILPTRSVMHDMGAITHKDVIVRKAILEKKPLGQVAEETDHTPEAVNNYVATYARVAYCLDRGMSLADTSFATGISNGLVKAYSRIRAELKQARASGGKGGEDR